MVIESDTELGEREMREKSWLIDLPSGIEKARRKWEFRAGNVETTRIQQASGDDKRKIDDADHLVDMTTSPSRPKSSVRRV